MGEPLILAVDIGTSSIRAALYSADGRVRGYTQKRHGVLRPEPFMEEQDPDAVRALVFDSIAACLEGAGGAGSDVRGMAFSSQMYSVFPVDAENAPLHNSILWSDGRAEAVVDAMRGRIDADALYRETGCPLNSLYPVAKIAWLLQNRPEICRRAAKYVSIKDYVLFPLLGGWKTDCSTASGSGMLDLANGRWSRLALAALGLAEEAFPELAAGWTPLAVRNGGMLRRWGLPETTPLFLGGGDGPLANIGSGANRVGGVNIDLGTSGAVRVAVDKPMFEPAGRLWCYAMQPGRWAYGGIVTNAGNALQWLGTNLAFPPAADPDAATSEIGKLAEEVPAGAGGVVCIPYFRKARAPNWDGRFRGTMLGLTAGHDLRHIARAAIEAIAFDLATILEMAAGGEATSPPVILTGGVSRTRLVPQLLADVFDAAVFMPSHCEGSMAGAAITGLRGAGLIADFAFERSAAAPGTLYEPARAEASFYRELRRRYSQLIKTIQDSGLLESIRS
ncbi:MAG: hypothetical protein LBT97_09320 [Planctomycetota bacterium]|jgi:gluconokinase|nr:hypothetical protein [Planctomycetota bacterium]